MYYILYLVYVKLLPFPEKNTKLLQKKRLFWLGSFCRLKNKEGKTISTFLGKMGGTAHTHMRYRVVNENMMM